MIVYFDGYCHLCNGFVDFVLRHDRSQKIQFASLQGETARQQLPTEGLKYLQSDGMPSTVIVTRIRQIDAKTKKYEKEKTLIVYQKSDAILQVFLELGGFWQLIYVFQIIPRFLRDFIYEQIAARRYKWWGERDQCRLPTGTEKGRLLP